LIAATYLCGDSSIAIIDSSCYRIPEVFQWW